MKVVKKVLYIIFLIICSILIMGSLFIKRIYPSISFEEVYFYALNGLEYSDNSIFIIGIKYCLILVVFLTIILYILLNKLYITKLIFKKVKRITIFKVIYSILLFILSIFIGLYNINFIDYVKNRYSYSSFIEDNYVEPDINNIEFDTKKNLITIYVESLETSMFTKEESGYWDYGVIEELYDLLNEDDTTVFYNNNLLEQMEELYTSSWTIASLFSNTSGLPFKYPVTSGYTPKSFMGGAYTLGEVLSDSGYYNELISSARTNFGGVKGYFIDNGNYTVIDSTNTYKYSLRLSSDDKTKWGFNDKYLFENAKKRLDIISKYNKPFNLSLVTVDTHFVDGIMNDYSITTYDTQYENVYATTSKLIYEFITWLKEQDYYDNTTIVIVGDHLSMQESYFENYGADKRYIYNCYINSYVSATNNKNRVYTSLDTYPTILASIGAKIKDNKLGLGVNLFSEEETLAEKYGISKLDEELNKSSLFYNSKIVGEDYINIINYRKDNNLNQTIDN